MVQSRFFQFRKIAKSGLFFQYLEKTFTLLLPPVLIIAMRCLPRGVALPATGLLTKTQVTPALASPHWLPIDRRIGFKILLITHKALDRWVLFQLLSPLATVRSLRSLGSSNQGLRTVLSSGLKAKCDCA